MKRAYADGSDAGGEEVPTLDPEIKARRDWLACLAHADPDALEAAWDRLDPAPTYEMLRAPETGLTMVRARTSEAGRVFNLGEMTVTRCAVRLVGGQVGVGYVAGRSKRHAALVALFDALLQDETRHDEVHASVILPLSATRAQQRAAEASRTADTKVEFFTMVRGE